MAARPGGTDNLVSLPHLNEDVLLNELKVRYRQDDIYTYVGDILIAIDPFKQLKIYDKQHQDKYKLKSGSRDRNPPHVYAVSEAAYQQMMAHKKNQCCIISGESGAGKTETCKFIIDQLVKISWGRTTVQQSIITFTPIIETFGNAHTSLNNNSSRFLKYTQLKFRNGQVVGAKVNEYLLEKSRVVDQNPGEQNFHIFYYLFAGLDQQKKDTLKLGNPDNYHYLCEGAAMLHHKMAEATQKFEEFSSAMDLVGFEADNQENLLRCVAAVLNMGNIEFGKDNNDHSFVKNKTGPLASVAELMKIDKLEDLLTVSESVIKGERIKRHLNQAEAIASRDAIAKNLYDRLFRWTINRINQLIAPSAEDMAQCLEIGVLDIFGFEKFEINDFEQLCVNITNEKLYNYFNERIFMLELQEYQKEGIKKKAYANINFKDNKAILDFFLEKPGILTLLDEENAFPRSNNATFVQKLHTKFEKLPFYAKPRNGASDGFIISHYAGKVEYDTTGFLDKNRDSLPSGAIEVIQASENPLIKLIFKGVITRTGTLALTICQPAGRTKRRLERPTSESLSKPKISTIATKFKNSLQVLFEKLDQANPHFVLCIKPNNSKAPNNFDDKCVAYQLKYTGVVDTAYMRKEGYAIRLKFQEFVECYCWLVSCVTIAGTSDNCHKILKSAKLHGYEVGKTKVFLKYWHVDKLNKSLASVNNAAIMIQKLVRGFICRQRFRKQLKQKTKPPSSFKPSPPKKIDTEAITDYENVYYADEDGDVFVATKPNTSKFGKEGTKEASIQWFKATQSKAVQTDKGEVYMWFHGFITRQQADQRLVDKPNGTFLIRVSESQLGFSLTFRVTGLGRCKHYLIKQTNSGKYIMVGEARVHRTLEELVNYYHKHPINTDGDLLTLVCQPTH